jgi:hypothetical protein
MRSSIICDINEILLVQSYEGERDKCGMQHARKLKNAYENLVLNHEEKSPLGR